MQQFPRSARLWIEPLESRLTPAVAVRFDYSFDTSGMFAAPEARAAMERVGAAITAHMTDTLSAIAPSGGNAWTAQVYDSASGSTHTIANPTVGANEVVVYVTGGSLGGALGIASGGAYSAHGSQDWLTTLRTRGQGGVDSGTDYAPWGGLIAFNTATNWDWSAGAPSHTQYDFDSVAMHEMMHVFGFGLENPSFTRNVSGGYYRGVYGTSVYGGLIPMQAGDASPDHFAAGVRFAGQDAVMNPAIAPGTQKQMTELEYACLRDVGWGISSSTAGGTALPPVATSPSAITPAATGPSRFLVSGSGGVTVYDASGQPVSQNGGLGANTRVASGDVNGDGVTDYVYGSAAGGPAKVTVVSGATGAVLYTFSPFESAFTGGVYVAAGDVNGDGRADIVVGAGENGGPRVKVYDGRTGAQLADFWGIDDPNFRGGVRPAVGDVNGDGYADLICAAGEGGGPRVAGYDGRTLGGTPTRLFADFMAFDANLRNGVYLAVADLNGDGYADVIAGAGDGGGPRVTGFSGKSLLNGVTTDWVANFFAGDPNTRGGVRVAAADVNGDGKADIITAPAPATDGLVRVYAGSAFRTSLDPSPYLTVSRAEWATNGAYVG